MFPCIPCSPMDSRLSVRNLGQTLEPLLGLKPHLTPNWVKSVCDIIKNLPSDFNPTNSDAKIDDNDGDYYSCNAISKIKDELAALTTCINQLNVQRRQLLNDFLDLKGNIRVFCRIRPFVLGENFGRVRPVAAVNSSDVLLKLADSKSKSYTFDRVFHPDSVQDEVFSEVEPVLKSVLHGYNACIFAYGQTGTGKTFTMEGTPDEPGVVPRTFEALFKQAVDSNHSFMISFSMLEIYMGSLKDLLVPRPTRPTDYIPPCLSVQTNQEGGTEIDNLVSIQVNDSHQALRLYRLGCRFRSTASTNSNVNSSRSHCMIRIAITCFDAPERQRKTTKIWLVDLGGSERVLKTKAWGKRLDEGKAINLSLSALGDVIYALQRKKCHIPYRNSKLTQVLKDSMGDDSKTLMLVHVSPKEEDLCETICSLNFATRAKSIHLINQETIEVRERKEVAMANLQQKIKEIEQEQLHSRREIEKLEKRLECLTGKSLSSEEQPKRHNFTEELLTENRARDTAVAPISKLPRFMRPTICSRQKSGTICQTPKWKVPAPGRRRKPSSHHAESVTFPVKDHSDYKSEYSVFKSSCLVGLDMRNSADNTTEYSQDISKIDVKMINLREQEKASRSSDSQMADVSHIQKNTSRPTGKTKYNKFLKVDNWLDLQNDGINMNDYTHRTRRIAIPTSEKKHEQSKAKDSFDEEANILYNFRMQKVVNHTKKDKPVTDGVIAITPSKLVVDEQPLTMQQDLFNGASRTNSIPLSQITEEKRKIQTQERLNISSSEDRKWHIFSPEDMTTHSCCKNKDDDGENTSSIMPLSDSDSFQLNNHGYHEFLQSDSDGSINYSKGDSGDSMSMLELEPCCQKLPMESIMENGSRRDSEFSIQPLAKERRHDILQMRAQKALFTNNTKWKDSIKQIDKIQVELRARGICHTLKQKIETLCTSTLLGLGFCSLGYEHDFFYGLLL